MKGSWLGRWLPAILWMGLIFFLSSRPDLPHHPEPLIDLILKKSAHLIEYAILAFLLARPLGKGKEMPILLTGGLYALSDEAHQSLVPGRNAAWSDVAVDLLGVALGLYFFRFWGRRR